MTTIRKAIITDSEKILPLRIKLMEFHSDENIIYKTSADFEGKVINDIREQIEKPNVTFFVVEQHNELVGYAMTTISARPDVFARKKKGYIGDTYVDAKVRGQGIGTKLITTIKKWFKSEGVDFVDLQVVKTNEEGKKFWEKNGFKTVNYYMVNDLTE